MEQKCPAAFAANGPIWSLLRENPDRSMYAALKKGCVLALPSDIEAGMHNVARRAAWNTSALEEYALPAEALLNAFQQIHLSLVTIGQQIHRHVTPLSKLQQHILFLLDCPPAISDRLGAESSKPT